MTDQRGTTAVHGDAADPVGTSVEFETDVMALLVAALRGAVKLGAAAVGTENLLAALVMGDSDAGAAIAPGMRKAGGLGGLVSGRGGRGWASTDDTAGPVPDAAGTVPDEDAADAYEITAAWREALWRFGRESRRPATGSDRPLPGMTGALRACLLSALKAARAEGTVSVRCRHVARALLELPDSRAREALMVERLDLAAAATALDALDASAPAGSERPDSHGVVLLRRAGTLGRSGNRLTRALTSWLSGSGQYGSPVLFAVFVEATRQAVRCGRSEARPVDLLLGILALDRALAVAGGALPEDLAAANSAAALLNRHGARLNPLNRAANTTTEDDAAGKVLFSDTAERAKAVAQLTAAEHGSATVGTVHLLAALLDDSAADVQSQDTTTQDLPAQDATSQVVTVGRLLTARHVDIAALRADLPLGPGA
ncbi:MULTISPECIES: Clp protease N-terminal domain-containing protein [unclassified Streptomyces]|uniref:Clp protease N-terminal domain-containing protein n=1 Tax=unclassified Streptomyces TaxID=2593676 RepID=UPI0038148C1B